MMARSRPPRKRGGGLLEAVELGRARLKGDPPIRGWRQGAPRALRSGRGAYAMPPAPRWPPFRDSGKAPRQAAAHSSPMRRNSASRAALTALAALRSVSAMAIASSCSKVTAGRSWAAASGSDLSRS